MLSALLPGLGQIYNGETSKGVALVLIAGGIIAAICFSVIGPAAMRSTLTCVMLAAVYVLVWAPAVVDANKGTSARARALLAGERRWYVIVMLLSAGPMALPLLWQSPRFSRAAKILWSVLVVAVALLAIFAIVVAGPMVEELLQNSSSLGGPL